MSPLTEHLARPHDEVSAFKRKLDRLEEQESEREALAQVFAARNEAYRQRWLEAYHGSRE